MLTQGQVEYLVQQYRIMRPLFLQQQTSRTEQMVWKKRWLAEYEAKRNKQ